MTDYFNGSASVTSGSRAVVGTNTTWKTSEVVGGMFTMGGIAIPIASVESETQLTLRYNWSASTRSGTYSIALATAQAATSVTILRRIQENVQALRNLSPLGRAITSAETTEAFRQLIGVSSGRFQVNASGTFAERARYDTEPPTFSYLATDRGLIYLREGASGWSTGLVFGKGDDGREIELRADDARIEWRYENEQNWRALVELELLKGADGREVEFNQSETHLQWRLIGEDVWIDLVPLSDITGPQGDRAASTQESIEAAERASQDAEATADDRRQTGEDRAATESDVVATAADRTAVAANLATTNENVAKTADDRRQTGEDRAATESDVVATAADRTAVAANLATTNENVAKTADDRRQTGEDRAATESDVVATAADRTAVAANLATTNENVAKTADDRRQTGEDRAATESDVVATAADRTAVAANLATTNENVAKTADDRRQTGEDRAATESDVVATAADRTAVAANLATTNENVAKTADDRRQTGEDRAAAAKSAADAALFDPSSYYTKEEIDARPAPDTSWDAIESKPNVFPPAPHSHLIDNIDGLTAVLASKSPSHEPTFTGLTRAPTVTASTNDNNVATTAFVRALLATADNVSALQRAVTSASGQNDTRVATTAFVQREATARINEQRQASRTDTTGNRFLTPGAFGLGASAPPNITDANAIPVTGSYGVQQNWIGSPFPDGDTRNYGIVVHESWAATYAVQLHMPANYGPIRYRQKVDGTWSAWQALATEADLASKLNLSGGTLTGALSSTPRTFEVLTGGTKAVAYAEGNRRHFELRSGANTFDVTGIPESGGDLELDLLYTAGTLAFTQTIRWKFNGIESTNLADTPVTLTAGVRYAVILWNMGGTLYGVIG